MSLEQIIQWKNTPKEKRSRVLLVVGPSGVGKSYMVKKVFGDIAHFTLSGRRLKSENIDEDRDIIQLAFSTPKPVVFDIMNTDSSLPREITKFPQYAIITAHNERIFSWDVVKGEIHTIRIGYPSDDEKRRVLREMSPALLPALFDRIIKKSKTFSDLQNSLLIPEDCWGNDDTVQPPQSIGDVLELVKGGKYRPSIPIPIGKTVDKRKIRPIDLIRPLFDAGCSNINNVRLLSKLTIMLDAYMKDNPETLALLSLYSTSSNISELSWSIKMGYKPPPEVIPKMTFEQKVPEKEIKHKKEPKKKESEKKKEPEKKSVSVFDFE